MIKLRSGGKARGHASARCWRERRTRAGRAGAARRGAVDANARLCHGVAGRDHAGARNGEREHTGTRNLGGGQRVPAGQPLDDPADQHALANHGGDPSAFAVGADVRHAVAARGVAHGIAPGGAQRSRRTARLDRRDRRDRGIAVGGRDDRGAVESDDVRSRARWGGACCRRQRARSDAAAKYVLRLLKPGGTVPRWGEKSCHAPCPCSSPL